MKPEAKRWRDLYEFDTPVIHVSKSDGKEERAELAPKAKKLMHRFTADDVEKEMDAVEEETAV